MRTKDIWKRPEITRFANVDEAMEHFRDRATPEELAYLRRMFKELGVPEHPDNHQLRKRWA